MSHPTKLIFVEGGPMTYAFEVSIDVAEIPPGTEPFGGVNTRLLECDPKLHKQWIELMDKLLAARDKAFKQGRIV